MSDMFEEFGESLIPKTLKRQREVEARREIAKAARAAIPPMVKRGLEKDQEDQSKQMVRYRLWKKQVFEGLLYTEQGDDIVELRRYLKRSTTTPDALAKYVTECKWIMKCTFDARETLLGYINHAISRWNVRNGYPDDDPIPSFDGTPDPPPSPFLIIRKHLTGV